MGKKGRSLEGAALPALRMRASLMGVISGGPVFEDEVASHNGVSLHSARHESRVSATSKDGRYTLLDVGVERIRNALVARVLRLADPVPAAPRRRTAALRVAATCPAF